MFVDLMCGWCGKSIKVLKGEYTRQVKKGRKFFFCNNSCAAKKINAERPNRRILVKKICPHCKKEFTTMTGCKSATFCSRSCASAGSMSEKRREAQRKGGKDKTENLLTPEETLRLREAWKYTKLISFLEFCNETFVFEFRFGDYIFDLALPNRFIFVEFDGIGHSSKEQSKTDTTKDMFAEQEGWKVIRKKVQSNTVISSSILHDILKKDN